MDTSTAVLVLRVALSLACVLGLLWWLARRTAGRPGVRRPRAVTPIVVVGRQSLGGRASVALVEVAGRHLLLGIGEQGVSLLTEVTLPEPEPEPRAEQREVLDPAELERLLGAPLDPTLPLSTPAARTPAVPTQRNPLDGSILAPSTWRRAVVAVQERTLRR